MSEQDQIIAASREMQQVLATVAQLATTDSTVLITGESGTGKELVARALYAQSARDARAVRADQLRRDGRDAARERAVRASQGRVHRRDRSTRRGCSRRRDGGVLFLDEIGEMPPSMQVRLLRFLQGGEVRPYRRHDDPPGGRAAGRGHAPVARAGGGGGAVPPGLLLPHQRRRRAGSAAARAAGRHSAAGPRRFFAASPRGCGGVSTGFTPRRWRCCRRTAGPATCASLRTRSSAAVNLASGPVIGETDLPASVTLQSANGVRPPPSKPGATSARRLVAALEQARWNQSRAAEKLGMSRSTLWRKMREHQIARRSVHRSRLRQQALRNSLAT